MEGTPKLLLPHRGASLLAGAIGVAHEVAPHVIVVVGAFADAYAAEARRSGAAVVTNPDWERGMGTSIRAGFGAVPRGTARALLLLADQPFVPAAHLAALLEALGPRVPIAVSRYGDGNDGVPVALAASLFGAVGALPDDGSAKALARRAPEVARIFLSRAAQRDIDTPADAARWLGVDVEPPSRE